MTRVKRRSGHRTAPAPSSSGSRRQSRVLLVLFFCSGIAGLGLLDGGDQRDAQALRRSQRDPMAGYYPAAMPRYPSVRELPLGGNTRVGASKLRMSYFTTKDEPAKIADYYLAHWRRRKLWTRDDITHVGGVAAAVDVKRGHLFQILIRKQGQSTLVFPSLNVQPLGANDKRGEPPIPLYPKSKILLDLDSGAAGARSRTILSTNEGTLEENVAHYRAMLITTGYHQQSGRLALPGDGKKTLSDDHRLFLFTGPSGEELTLSITRLGKNKVRVNLMLNARQKARAR